MSFSPRASRLSRLAAVLIGATASLGAQQPSSDTASRAGARDTVVQASERYAAGGFFRDLFGTNYRKLWALPIRVPILDLQTYAGGLRPIKEGGNAQTTNLRFMAANGGEYVFRPVFKDRLVLDDVWKGTVVSQLFADGLSASHPAATLIAPPILAAAGIPHPTPVLVLMPNDSSLGKFRKDFAGTLGTIEEYPSVPDDAPGFDGAVQIIDSDDLLKRLNKDPREHIDAATLLKARLVDMFINDDDRHPGQWKWARMQRDDNASWVPIPRDRDKAMVSYEGRLVRLGRYAIPELVTFSDQIPSPHALFANAIEFDRRLLGGLDEATWDSITVDLVHSITDSVIDAAIHRLPREYQAAQPNLAATFRARRSDLKRASREFFRGLFFDVDLHATDASDRASVTRPLDGVVDVTLQKGSEPPWYRRRFDANLTREVRLYLHNGNDTAVVRGTVSRSIPFRIIGGNGDNVLADSSIVGARRRTALLYDAVHTDSPRYKADTVDGQSYDPDTAWNRRPWQAAYGTRLPPVTDRGSAVRPILGLRSGQSLGFAPRIGLSRTQYGFEAVPYASTMRLTAAYSERIRGAEVRLDTDNRFESSPWHVATQEFVTQLDAVEFHGLGNDRADVQGNVFYETRQLEFLFHPTVGYALGPLTDVTIGPVVKYSVTDSTPNRFIAEARPLGLGRFGQAGLQMDFRHDTRDDPGFPRRGFVTQFTGSYFPATWSVKSPFEKVTAVATTYFTIPVLTRPVLALRAGMDKLFGAFPYYEAAFLGGSNTVRTYHFRQYAGDAAYYGSTELRVPVAQFPLFLPWNLGLIGFADAGRVYVDGDSPGGWHSAAGVGGWIAVARPGTGVSILLTNRSERRYTFGLGFHF